MAKKQQEETALATVTPAETALATVPQDLIEDAGRGTENIGADDVRPPRLLVCQSQSPYRERKNTDKSIAGLDEPMMFNDLTGEIYGEGPLKFVVITKLGVRGVQFGADNKVLDFNVPLDDARMQFTTATQDSADGKIKRGDRVKPVATKFCDYLIFLVDQQELVALSMKGGQLKVATTLDSLVKLPLKLGKTLIAKPPAWARQFTLSTKVVNENGYSFAKLTVAQAGLAADETRAIARAIADTYAKKKVVVAVDEDDAADARGSDDFVNPDGTEKF